MTSNGVSNAEQKKALLLHTAGPSVQDISYTLNVHTPQGEQATVYTVVLGLLDAQFQLQVNAAFE